MTLRGLLVSVLTTALAMPAVGADEALKAHAAENSDADTAEAEVVITATKRTSTVQDTPVSISAVSGDNLQTRGISDVSTLVQATPGVSLKSEGPGQTEIEMRGMTSSGGNSPTVGFYLDDIPLSPPAGAQNGKVVISPSLYDLNRVEVLRGPQGTLYGSGSMGGTLRLITNQPDPRAFHASAESILSGTDGGGFNHTDNLMVNIPLVNDTLALRMVGTESYTSGWINRIVSNALPVVTDSGATRGDVRSAPITAQYPHSNAEQLYSFRAAVLWKPTDRLSITPSFLYLTLRADGISAFDSVPGTQAHYQPFDIAEPLTDRITAESLNVTYSFDSFDVTSSSAYWSRRSTQLEEGSEDFNNPLTGATLYSNGCPAQPSSCPAQNPGYYGPAGTGQVYGYENDPTAQTSEELRFASRDNGGPFSWVGGGFFSHYWATWNFNGTTANPSQYMDLGTNMAATTPHWFDAVSPTTIEQYAVFGDGIYAITNNLKLDAGLRWYKFDYRFWSSISGWGSGLGAAAPSLSGLIKQSENGVNPKFNLSYSFDADRMVYATAAKGFRPGGGNAQYPTTGVVWSAAYQPYNFTGNKWPTSYRSDSVWSYELGGKSRWFDRRLTINASGYFERWNNIQLLAFPSDWALNLNGNHATIYGGDIDARAVLGAGFVLSAAVGYTRARVDSGAHWQITPTNVLPDVAPVNGTVNLTYTKGVSDHYTFTSQAEYAYVDHRYSLDFLYGHSANGEYSLLPSYGLANFRAGIESDGGWGAALFVNNAFNKRAQLENLFQETLPSAAFNRVVTNQPLTAGIDLTYRY
jgi:iron complex outermembrane recepter protein